MSAWAFRLPYGWRAALDSLAGGVYVGPFCGERASAPTPPIPQKSPLEVPGLSFLVVPPPGYFKGRRPTGIFLFGLNCNIRHKGSP
jgi:hypothetical protein